MTSKNSQARPSLAARLDVTDPTSVEALIERTFAAFEEARREVAAQVPLGRLGRVDEVAHTVAWPLSEQVSFLTGATIPVDGGRLAGGA